jgi:hypothetical protein
VAFIGVALLVASRTLEVATFFSCTGDVCMGDHAKPQKTSPSGRRPISREKLLHKMSELISLREKVAQAELAAQLYEVTQAAHGENFPGAGGGEDT